MKRNEKTERNRHIYKCRVNGVTYRKIAEVHGISISRVRQIVEVEKRKKEQRYKDIIESEKKKLTTSQEEQ